MDDLEKGQINENIIVPFYASLTQRQYIATCQYTINAVGQRVQVTAVSFLL